MKTYAVDGHEDSWLPDGFQWKLAWSDEFDGEVLDTEKWDFRTTMMGKVHPAWTRNGVRLDGKGNVEFKLIIEDGRPVSSQLQTGYNFMDQPVVPTKFGNDYLQWPIGKLHQSKFLHKYGYYECRCRLQQKPGWWSAFWIQSPIIGASLDTGQVGAEIDVMESFRPGQIAKHFVHARGYGLDRVSVGTDKEHTGLSVEEFHRFGVLWDETGYTFYVNGVEDGRVTDNISHCPEFILITTEVSGYRGKDHAPVQAAFDSVGDTFLVDYVRVFDAVR